MAILCFELTMPSNNSWNGRWSGEGQLYAKTRFFATREKVDRILKGHRYYYDFGDGWCACVSVREISASEVSSIAMRSRGFAGYDWMIDSIIKHGDIRPEVARV